MLYYIHTIWRPGEAAELPSDLDSYSDASGEESEESSTTTTSSMSSSSEEVEVFVEPPTEDTEIARQFGRALATQVQAAAHVSFGLRLCLRHPAPLAAATASNSTASKSGTILHFMI